MTAVRSAAELVRPEVRRARPYELDLAPCRFKLDQNEVPWDLPRAVKRRIAERLLARDWGRYPDFHGEALRRALAKFHGHPASGVLVGNGSNELLGVALEAVAGPGVEVLALAPGFALYRLMIERTGAAARFLGPRPDLRLPWAELSAEVARDPRRPVILTSPNNPTGEAATVRDVEALLDRLDAPLLLDNAYGEFSTEDYRPLLARHPNLLLFRTFSKAWSLAGLRLGYLLAAPELVSELAKVKLPYNVGHAALIAGEECLAARPALARRVRLLVARRGQWQAMLEARGFEVFPSQANFLLVRFPGGDAAHVYAGLARCGIRVRDVSAGAGLAGCLRISIAGGAALRATAKALDEVLVERTQ